MSEENIDSFFERKIQQLHDSADFFMSHADPPKGVLPFAFAMLIKNLEDLYGISQLILKMALESRNERKKFATKKDQSDVKNNVADLTNRFNNTFGKLEDRLNKINKADEAAKKKGDNPFYG